jgi:chemotaxis protein methyltransferase CheR
METVLSALNVGETHFFRDQRQMQALELRILPELIAARRNERRLRIWSAGCSTGEEAYTLAILVDRLLAGRTGWDVTILGTDLNEAALERARLGSYGSWSLRGCSELAGSPYLTHRDRRFHVAPAIRAMVTFAPLNLTEDVYPSRFTGTHAMDLVVCRNVLLYFDRDAARSVVRRLGEALAPDGRLMVSQVESGMPLFDGLGPDPSGPAVFRRAAGDLPPTAAQTTGNWLPAAARGEAQPRTAPAGAPGSLDSPRSRRLPSSLGRHHRMGVPGSPAAQVLQTAQVLQAAQIPQVGQAAQAPETARGGGRPGEPGAAGGTQPYAAALGLWHTGLQDEALRFLEDEVSRDPDDAALHYLQGLILLDKAQPDEALEAFRRCTCADPAFVAGHVASAGLLARAGLGDRAMVSLRTATHLVAGRDPDEVVLEWDGLTVADVLDLVTTQRRLLAPGRRQEASRARA